MKVILAGYNLDQGIIARLRDALAAQTQASGPGPSLLDPAALSPETLAAAYARISRDPRPIPELREEAIADVAAARRSNRRIIFGFGHASIAEHAVFNLDALDVSRLAIEALEATRLGSYTEKSQRYILLDRDYVVPEEIVAAGLEAPFRELLAAQQEAYGEAYRRLVAHYREHAAGAWAEAADRRRLEGAAKEDARYCLGLATTGQVGVTLNARSLEATVRRLAADPLAEVRALGLHLHRAVADVAPSLVRHTDATPLRRDAPHALRACVARLMQDVRTGSGEAPPASAPDVKLVAVSADAERRLAIALVHAHSDLDWDAAAALVDRLGAAERRQLLLECLQQLDAHEPPPRAFEIPEFTFELVLSASCFAQLKRHRMATLIAQPYDPALGVTIPPVFGKTGLTSLYARVREHSEELFRRLPPGHPAAAYALTNGHRRRVLFKANARELYHLSRLRLDEHAQWDIRRLAAEMVRRAREVMPLAMLLTAGKDEYARVRRERLGEAGI